MKRLFLAASILFLMVIYAHAEDETTRFLGIPVDGPKAEMTRKLEAKGYVYVSGEDYFTGYYMGDPVYLFIQMVNDKVARIIVYDIEPRSEEEIKYRFNSVYERFARNKRYARLGKRNKILTEKDKLLYEMKHHNYVHKAIFRQVCVDESDEDIVRASAQGVGTHPIDMEALKFDYKERRRRIHARALGYANRHNAESYSSQVWFAISERFGRFAMVMFYDNVPNLLAEREVPHF